MDIKNTFILSFEFLKKNKQIVIPALLSFVLPIIILFLYAYFSGLHSAFQSYARLSSEFDEQRREYVIETKNFSNFEYWEKSLGYLGKRGSYEDDLDRYLEAGGFYAQGGEFFNARNVIFLIIFILTAVLCWMYFSCMTYASALAALKNKKAKLLDFNLTNKFFIKYITIFILFIIIMLAPLAFFGILIFSSFLSKDIIALLGVFEIFVFIFFVFIILALAYIVYIGVRFFFDLSILFIDGAGPVSSLKKAFTISRGNFKLILALFGIYYGLQVLTQSIGSSPFLDSLYNFLISDSIIKSVILFFVILIFLVIASLISAFQAVFLLQSYIDFKRNSKTKGE